MSQEESDNPPRASSDAWKAITAAKSARPTVQKWASYWDLPPAPLCFPVKGSAGKTGEWRTFAPIVDHTNCMKCYVCYMMCPEGTITVNETTKFIEIDLTYCKGCGICALNCPKKCITMDREAK